MEIHEHEEPWIKRVEELITLLEGTTIGELELTEAGTEIIIRRRPDMMMVSMPVEQISIAQPGVQPPKAAARPAPAKPKEDHSIPIVAPLTGVYYSSPSPTLPPFVTPGDIVHTGQLIALIEAMKVFNEIQAEVSGRVVAMVAENGEVVQKGDALIRVEPV
ncbi:MAG TPA: biotin/lipoyl-containing protein [Ktedonobacteraceae bacterium]|nr:biotin/lipoyl-containing protein [Ktedonobacteraceae bacterium]